LGDSWRLIEAAAGAQDGTVEFSSGDFVTSRVDAHGTNRVAAIDVLPMLEGVDLLKLDAEGAEWPILLDPRFVAAAPPLLALEYHPWMCPAPDARAAALEALERGGYEIEEVETTAPPGHGSLWAWRDRAG
jgi:hypothetical protein